MAMDIGCIALKRDKVRCDQAFYIDCLDQILTLTLTSCYTV